MNIRMPSNRRTIFRVAIAALLFSSPVFAVLNVYRPTEKQISLDEAAKLGFNAFWGNVARDGLTNFQVRCPEKIEGMSLIHASAFVYVNDKLITIASAGLSRDFKNQQWASIAANKEAVKKIVFHFGYGSGNLPSIYYLVIYNTEDYEYYKQEPGNRIIN